MNLLHTTVLGLLFLLGSVGKSFSQGDDLLTSIGDRLESMVDDYVIETFLASRFSQDVSDLPQLFCPSKLDSQRVQVIESERLAEIALIASDRSLEAQGSHLNNFAGSLLEDDGTFYKWRTNAGIGWNVLRDGMVAKKQRVKQKQLEWEAEKSIEDERIRKEAYQDLYASILYAFNQKKVEVIKNRLQILTQLYDVVHKLFYLRFVHWEEVLDVMSKKTETQLFLKNYSTYLSSVQLDSNMKQTDLLELPVFDLVYEKVQEQGLDTLAQFIAMEKRVQAVEHQFHWSKDVSLNANMRYSYFQGGPGASYGQRDFLTGGLTFAVPLSFQKKERGQYKRAKVDRIKTDYQQYYEGMNNEVLNEYYEYQYALKQYVNFYYKKERLGVLIKRAIRKRNLADPDYSPKMVVDKLDELFSVDLEILDIQQKMYLHALKIFQSINAEDVLPFIEVKDYNLFNNQFAGDRTILCPRKDFADLELNYLIELLRFNDFKEVMVQTDGDLDLYLKYAELLDELQDKEMSVRFSVSLSDDSTSDLSLLRNAWSMALTPLLHLDLTGVKSSNLPKILEGVRTLIEFDERSLDVSISIRSGDVGSLVESLQSYSSINLVPQSPGEASTVTPDLITLQNMGIENVRPIINPTDFNTRFEMDTFIEELLQHLNVRQVCISNVGGLLDLEAQTISWHEQRGF